MVVALQPMIEVGILFAHAAELALIQSVQSLSQYNGSDERWRIGSSGIRLEDIVLVSLEHVAKASWQPVLHVVRDARSRRSRPW